MAALLTPAAAACPHFPRCAGCPLVGRPYAEQLAWKRDVVVRALQEALPDASIADVVAPVEPAVTSCGYRVQAKLMVGVRRDGPVIGLYRPGTHHIDDASGCPLHDPLLTATIAAVRDAVARERMPIHGRGRTGVRYLLLRASVATRKVLVTLVTSRVDLDAAARVARRVRRDVEVAGLHVNENATTGNVIVGERMHRVWGEPDLVERYGDVTLAAPATAFVQANTTMAARIYAAIAAAADLRGDERVVDLYCGVGGIALTLAARAAAVLGIEEIESAVAAARGNAARNGRENVRFEAGFVEQAVAGAVTGCALVTLNPPRKGCGDAVARAVAAAAPARILYLSCSPRSLARDAAVLAGNGYRLTAAQPFDLLPHTEHVEVLASFVGGA